MSDKLAPFQIYFPSKSGAVRYAVEVCGLTTVRANRCVGVDKLDGRIWLDIQRVYSELCWYVGRKEAKFPLLPPDPESLKRYTKIDVYKQVVA